VQKLGRARRRRNARVTNAAVGNPVISVLLPARDAQATVEEALDGILAQRDAPPFEVVCVDDASADGTGALLARAAERDARVRVLRGEGRGLVAALQLGLLQCRGTYVARMDADDLVHPDRLRLQHALLESDPRLGAVGSLVRCEPPTQGLTRLETWLNSVVTAQECERARFIEAPLVHPSTTFRTAALRELGGWQDHGWAEDWDLLLRLVERGFCLAKVPEVLLTWRDRASRLTRTHAAYAPEQMIRLRAHYLARGPLRDRPFDLWGAGPTGKRLARALEPHGLRPGRFLDIDPRKKRARGLEVVQARTGLTPPDGRFLLCAVGADGARDTIRAMLEPVGWREGNDYLFAA
jgi:glycosyltransferase involved in cell wall biosynthesis